MKKYKIILTLILLACLNFGCEKDDLCAEEVTTPKLVISFINITDRTSLKPVNNLEIRGVGKTDSLAVFNNVSTISIPLKTGADFSEYSFELFSNNPEIANTDFIRFNYIRNEVFVSRACGYKTLFTLEENAAFLLTDNNPADTYWIKEIAVNQPDIINEDETHVNIYY